MSKYKPVSTLLSVPGNNLQSLLKRAQYLQRLTCVLQEQIDPLLSEHITVANLRDSTAIIVTDSPAWLSKIRYLAPIILEVLKVQPGLSNLSNIEFKVQPSGDPMTATHESRQINLSTNSSRVLESAASGISDPELADALRRLSQKGKAHSS